MTDTTEAYVPLVRTVPVRSVTSAYCGVTNWTLVHDLVRACVAIKDNPASEIARALVEQALVGVDEAHALAIQYRRDLPNDPFSTETTDDGRVPLISESEDGTIWVSQSILIQVEDTEDQDDADAEDVQDEDDTADAVVDMPEA